VKSNKELLPVLKANARILLKLHRERSHILAKVVFPQEGKNTIVVGYGKKG